MDVSKTFSFVNILSFMDTEKGLPLRPSFQDIVLYTVVFIILLSLVVFTDRFVCVVYLITNQSCFSFSSSLRVSYMFNLVEAVIFSVHI